MKDKKKKQACEKNNYFNKFQSEFGCNRTASLSQEDNKEVQEALRQYLTNNPLPYEDESKEIPIEQT